MTALVHRRNRHPHRGRKRRAAFGSRGGGRTAAGGLWDDHGLALYLLGYALTGSSEDARFLVAEAITDYDSGPDRTGRRCTGGVRAELARLVYLGSERGGGASGQAVMLREHADGTVAESLPMQEVMIWLLAVPARERAAIALCLYGDHTYREAAEVLAMSAADVAALLSFGMHELAATSVDGTAGTL